MTNFDYLLEMFRVVVFCLALSHALGAIPHVLLNGTYDLGAMPYIINGENAEEGKYPYQVSLHTPTGTNWKIHQCGASILTKNWVLTAAHCCASGVYSIMVGSNSLSKGGQTHKTSSRHIHPQYTQSKYWRNDICLIRLATPIQFNSAAQPVLLPPQGKQLKENDLLTVTGWGYTKPDDATTTPDKLQVGKNYKFLPLDKCGNVTNINMFDGYLCVLGNRPGQGICQGDSGGPVVKDGVQFGVASFIFMPCGNPLPDFFARVPNYINWIKETLGSEAAELKFST